MSASRRFENGEPPQRTLDRRIHTSDGLLGLLAREIPRPRRITLEDNMTSLLRRSFFRILLTVALCAATSLAMYSQSTTDGAICGPVTDPQKGRGPNPKIPVPKTRRDQEGYPNADKARGL